MKHFFITVNIIVLVLFLFCPVGFTAQTVPVLLYHRIDGISHPLHISPKRFENQLKAIKEAGYTTITLEQYNNFVLGLAIDLPEKPILITFDDGDADNYDAAFPILQRFGARATFFVPTGLLDLPGRITSSQLLEMRHAGMSIGSHTLTHRRLTSLDKTDLTAELALSKQALEELLGTPVECIAYPGGSYNETVLQAAKNAGYKIGFTTVSGRNSRGTPPLLMKRIPVFSFSPHILTLIENAR